MGPQVQIKVTPAAEADLPFLAVVKRKALGHLLISEAIWGKVPEHLVDDFRVREFGQMLRNDKVTVQKAEVDGKIVGIGVWHEPGYVPDDDIPYPSGADVEICDEFFASMALDHGRPGYREFLAAVDLAVLGVLPEYQGQGVGRAILGWGMRQADASNHSIFLESTEDGIRTYLKNGFYHIRELLVSGPDRNFTINPMHRPSRFELSSNPSRFSIQPVMPEDLERIAQIHLSFGTGNPPSSQDPGSMKGKIAAYKEQLKDDRAFRFYKAVDGSSGAVVAAASWRAPFALLRDDQPSPFGKGRIGLLSLVVDTSLQVQGLEKEMLAAVSPEAERMGWTVDSNGAPSPSAGDATDSHPHGQWVYALRGESETTISQATPEDFPEIARVRREAFEPSLIHQTLFGQTNPVEFDRFTIKRLEKSFRDSQQATWVARVGGKIVGFSGWHLPREHDTSEMKMKEKSGRDWSTVYAPGAEYELAGEFFSQLGRTERVSPGYLLGSLCVEPKYQGQGIGSALIQWGLDRADEEGVPCYTDASYVAIPTYKKAGFNSYAEPVYGGRNRKLVVGGAGALSGTVA
ncbi:BQ2448_7240 [Microbotryum intermedium]|uniref:BQ2448_7240 protein n=1 Tax=Microbotryum intermedium TaxID=269621 RepID=A0A238FN46_9BASI|nr:BQ2448_7240 [Microbotryum intermedium]